MLRANTLKGELNSQQSTNASWLVTTSKATLKIPIHKFEKSIFLFKRIYAAAVRNSKILAAFKCDLGAAIAAHKYSSFNHIWELSVLNYHTIMVIYTYPFFMVITQFFSWIIFIHYCICILTFSPR